MAKRKTKRKTTCKRAWPITEWDIAEVRKEVDRMAAELQAESPLKNKAMAKTTAEEVAILHVRLRFLHENAIAGKLSAEEGRTMPAVASQILRGKKALRLHEATVEEDEDLL